MEIGLGVLVTIGVLTEAVVSILSSWKAALPIFVMTSWCVPLASVGVE